MTQPSKRVKVCYPNEAYIMHVPDEIIKLMLYFLRAEWKSIIYFSMTCKKFNKISSENSVWKEATSQVCDAAWYETLLHIASGKSPYSWTDL